MDQEQIKKIIDSPEEYDNSKEDSILSMAKDFYSRRMVGTAIMVWVFALIFFVPCIYSGIKFFDTEQTKYQIMYAAIFISCFQGVGLMKIFAWEMIHRNSIKREIKRLEIRIADLSRTVKEK